MTGGQIDLKAIRVPIFIQIYWPYTQIMEANKFMSYEGGSVDYKAYDSLTSLMT